jgi:hypothetical protein
VSENDEIEPDASQVLLRRARVAARTFAAAGISSAAGVETSAMSIDLAQFDAVLDLVMEAACDQLRDAILRAYPSCTPAAADQAALEFLSSWGKTAAAEGLLIAQGDEAGLARISEDRKRLLAQLLKQVADQS